MRRERRQRTYKAGRAVVNQTYSTFDVVIRDMSRSGARLQFKEPNLVPEMFDLVILNTNTDTPERRPCIKRWQRGAMMGVEFIKTSGPGRVHRYRRDDAEISATQPAKPDTRPGVTADQPMFSPWSSGEAAGPPA